MLAALSFAPAASAQSLPRPERPWQTISTPHFNVHYPTEMRVWAEPVAQRMETVAEAVNALVGNAPRSRVTVVIEDPSNVSNGFALPFLEGPVVFFWPTPPAPGLTIGANRGWGEMLAVHEYGHIAHLTYPSRNPFDQFIWRFLPTKIGPVARKSPAWVIEGYATFIEGRLTGSGRPSSVGRAAVLRTWALDGKLPTYEQLNSTGPFLGGSMRYLVGSAFLEWLVQQKGDGSLPNVWRRMSARQSRSFAEAFRGVYGAYPDELYGRFYVDVMSGALEVRRQLQTAGLEGGELMQHYRWAVGGPAVSRDGRLVALSVGARGRPSRLEVWRTDGAIDSTLRERRARMLERDSLDVPGIDSFPPPRRIVATLRASAGRSAESPRFFTDSERILVVRDEPLGDGAIRPDLFVWSFKTGSLRRITHGAAIRSADPSPDGRTATGAQCLNGICSLVLVDLVTGSIRTLAAGSTDVVWNRPRYAPDGSEVAASVQRDGHWHVAVVTVATGNVRMLDPGDGADRYAPAFAADGQLVVVSERGGVANLEVLPVSGGEPRTLTRLTSAALAPDVSATDGNAYFLSLHARGYDVRRIAVTGTRAVPLESLDPRLFPVAPLAPAPRPSFGARTVDGPRAYGVGPRRWRLLPGGTAGVDGAMVTLNLANTDPVGRLGVLVTGGYGTESSWRGASIAAESRAAPVRVTGAAWYSEQRPSRQPAWQSGPGSFDATSFGAGAMLTAGREQSTWGARIRAGGAGASLNLPMLDGTRRMGIGDLTGRLSLGVGSGSLQMTGGMLLARGATAADLWSLGISRGSMTMVQSLGWLRVEGIMGHVTPGGVATGGRRYEQFLVGGAVLPLADADYLPNRIAMPGVPAGYATGQRVAVARLTLGGQLLEPSVTWVAGGDTRTAWKRVIALDREVRFPSLGYARLPGVYARGGISYTLDAPYAHKVRPYASLVYRP